MPIVVSEAVIKFFESVVDFYYNVYSILHFIRESLKW